jgi:hypothetical protein
VSQLCDGLVDESVDFRDPGDISVHQQSTLTNVGEGFLSAFAIHVRNDDLSALTSEAEHKCTAYPVATAGYNCDFVLQLHDFLLMRKQEALTSLVFLLW